MSGFPKEKRQAIIDGYLSETGRNMFVAGEFIDWLADRPDHQCYSWFFSKDDAEAAREYRIDLARRMASGLRIVSTVSQAPDKSQVVHITTREFPAYVSPVAGRRSGGGYERFNPDDADAVAELRRQGASALRGWLSRYRGAFEAAGVDLSGIEKIATSEDESVAKSA